MSNGLLVKNPSRSITCHIAKKVLDDIRFDLTDEKTVVGITTMQGESNTTDIAEDHSISQQRHRWSLLLDRLIIHFEPHIFTCQRATYSVGSPELYIPI